MKRTRHAVQVTVGLVLLVACGPLFADSARGRPDDRRDSYRGQSEQRQDQYRNDNRRSARAESGNKNRGEQRPLGTTRDGAGARHRDDAAHRGNARYRGNDDRDARRAADAVRRDERGRVLSSERADDRGYRVRVLTPDGYVRERYVDPRDERGDQRRRD